MTRNFRPLQTLTKSMVLLIGLLVVLWGCPPMDRGTRGGSGGPQYHLWQPLTAMHSEEKGFGEYTYVLFGRRLKPVGVLKEETLDRYERLLEAIHSSTLSKAEAGQFDKADTNVFLIPLTAEVETPDRHSYSTALSLRHISLCSAMVREPAPDLSGRLANNEGPFLISTPVPLAEIDEQRMVLLYADLSKTNPAAMAEVVRAYKRRVTKGGRELEHFTSLRLALLDIIFDADDNIKIVKAALAQD